MKWVDSHSGDWTPKQAGSIFPAIAIKLYEQAPEQFVSWVESNADHPQHDSIMGTVVRKLASDRNSAEAKRWIDVIKDNATRTTCNNNFSGCRLRIDRARLPNARKGMVLHRQNTARIIRCERIAL
jgi:hypothetical protein